MTVVLLLALVWAAILVPPAVRAHAERREAFLVSFGETSPAVASPRRSPSQRVRCRRRVAGGLLVAMAVTLVVGFLPTFRVLLVVHLFLVDSFLAYVAVLAFQAERSARAAARSPKVALGAGFEPVTPAGPKGRARRPRVREVVGVPELGPVAPAG